MDQPYIPRSPNLSGYAPRSPDLGGYRPTSPAGQDPYAPQSPDLSGLQAAQQHAYPQQLAAQPAFGLDQHQPPQPLQPWDQSTYEHQSSAYPLADQHPDPYQPHFSYPTQQPLYPEQYPPYSEMPVQTRNRGVRAPDEIGSMNDSKSNDDAEWSLQPPVSTPARRGRKPKSESSNGASGAATTSATPILKKMDTGGIEVKTKFPTARIKRIMQADEDVGKVAQVTPVVMAKALELFMIRLISASAGVAKQRGSKRVLSQHMKTAVMQDEQFDNLRDIVGRVPDAPSKGAAAGDNSDEEEGAPKKGPGRGRKAAAGAGGGRGKKQRRDSDDF